MKVNNNNKPSLLKARRSSIPFTIKLCMYLSNSKHTYVTTKYIAISKDAFKGDFIAVALFATKKDTAK
jgi:hypothetical protein